MKDTYQTIGALSEGEFRDRGSKFLAYAYPVYNVEDVQEKLLEVKKLHPKARHFCYAYRLGMDKNNFRANDDGEPSGTAGRPILGQIDSFELTNTISIVVRYFGGTKLGTSGLINAYKVSTAAALENANVIQKTVEDIYRIDFTYENMSQVMNAVKEMDLEILVKDFGESPSIEIAIRQSEVEATLIRMKAKIAKVSLNEAEAMEALEGVQVEHTSTR